MVSIKLPLPLNAQMMLQPLSKDGDYNDRPRRFGAAPKRLFDMGG